MVGESRNKERTKITLVQREIIKMWKENSTHRSGVGRNCITIQNTISIKIMFGSRVTIEYNNKCKTLAMG